MLTLLNAEIAQAHAHLTPERRTYWKQRGLDDVTLERFQIGYLSTGYYVLPYFDTEGNCFFYKAINIAKQQYWYPAGYDEAVRLFNIAAIAQARATGQRLHLAEGEKDCLVLAMLGLLAVGISGAEGFVERYVPLFEGINDIVIAYDHDTAGRQGGRKTAELLGRRARLLVWPKEYPDKTDVNALYLAAPEQFLAVFHELVRQAVAVWQPLLQPASSTFEVVLERHLQRGDHPLVGLATRFPRVDAVTHGLRGLVVLGGPPKIGKSLYTLLVACNAAEDGNLVVYLDFENGLLKLLLRILSRLAQTPMTQLLLQRETLQEILGLSPLQQRFIAISQNFYVHRPSLKDVTQERRELVETSSALLRRYVACLREDLGRTEPLLIVVDSLQKLPVWSLSDRRSGIDAWLRSFEAIKEECGVTFLIVSELARGAYDKPSIEAFKESGDVEYSADLAFQMKRAKDARGEDVIELHAVANRDGEQGLIATYRPRYDCCDFDELPSNLVSEELRRAR